MKIIYISSEDKTRKHLYISSLSSFLSKDNKVLIINMESSREFEIYLEIEDFIIYDYLDYFSGICDLDQACFEINENLSIMPTAFKFDKYKMKEEDYKNIEKLLKYDYIFINGNLNIMEYFENIDFISDYLKEDVLGDKYYIHNKSYSKKINFKLKKHIEEKAYKIIGEKEILISTKNEELNDLWEVYTGIRNFEMEKGILGRIFNR